MSIEADLARQLRRACGSVIGEDPMRRVTAVRVLEAVKQEILDAAEAWHPGGRQAIERELVDRPLDLAGLA